MKFRLFFNEIVVHEDQGKDLMSDIFLITREPRRQD